MENKENRIEEECEKNIRGKESIKGRTKKGTAMQAEILGLIEFGGLFSIVSEDVTLSTEEAEARMCDSAVEIFVCAHVRHRKLGGINERETESNERRGRKEDKKAKKDRPKQMGINGRVEYHTFWWQRMYK